MTLREQIARLIAPSRWSVFDGYLADMKRKYAGKNAAYDPDNFKDAASLKTADAILAPLPALPPGWVAVPEEPDMSMLHAALEWNRVQPADERPLRVGFEYHDAPAIYRAMLSARPAPPTETER